MSADRSVGGLVSHDPLADLPIGSSLKSELVRFGHSNATDRPNWVNNWDFFSGAMLGFVLKTRDGQELIGTAVIVAPGLAVTATHNFFDLLGEIQAGAIVPYCYGIRKSALDIWRVVKISCSDEDDIAYLSLKAASALPADGTHYQFGITTRAPKNGETLHILGFRSEPENVEMSEFRVTANLYAAAESFPPCIHTGEIVCCCRIRLSS